MEGSEVGELPVEEQPVQITDQIFVQDEGTRVLKPETQESQPPQQDAARSEFDISKLGYELQQGYRIYRELLADSNRNVTWPFVEPVDADSLGLWDYYERIKRPMCFSTIGSKFLDNEYTSITEVVADVRLILENCYRYNGPNHWVSKLGQKLEKILEQKLALLNRSLRDKVTLGATMTINNGIPLNDFEVSGRRRSSRQNYLSMVNGENSSSLVNHLKIIEESEEKERRRQREKEKKEANQALLQDLEEWEEKELTAEIINQLHSMWEIPSVGSLLYMVKDILGIEDINLTEFELSFVYPNKSSLLARIFTGLLITPHQRKSIYKRPSMKFKMWESKLKEKLCAWYKLYEKEGPFGVSLQYGIDLKFFDIVGNEKNPLEEKSYLDLTLHQRIWVLKALCDVCFHKDYDIREKVTTCDSMEQRELFLGCDAEDQSYIYFPIFQTTDVRVYRHNPLEVPSLKPSPKKEPSPPPPPPPPPPEKKPRRSSCTPTRTPRSARLRQLRGCAVEEEKEKEKKEEKEEEKKEMKEEKEEEKEERTEEEKKEDKEPAPDSSSEAQETTKADNKSLSPAPHPPVFQCEDGFHMACHDIETLKSLTEQFAELPPPPKKRGRRSKPPPIRKRCVVDLHETLLALLQELEKYELAFSRNCTKAKIKIMKESLEPEPVDEPEEESEPEGVEEWESDLSDDDAGAKLDAQDDDYRIEDEYGNPQEVEKTVETEQNTSDSDDTVQTEAALNKRKRKLSKGEDGNGNENSIAIQTPPLKIKKKPKKWSPTKEKVLPPTTTGLSPTVVISPVTAEESLKATSQTSDTKVSPDKILLNALGQAIKRAKEHASALQSTNTNDVASNNVNVDGTSKVLGNASSPQNANSISGSKCNRKRILVSPEGKAHEIKPSFHIVSTQASSTTPTTSALPSHPPIQRKSDIMTVVSKHGTPITATLGPHGIKITPTSKSKSVPVRPINNQEGLRTIHQKPNILSKSKKQPTVDSKTVVLPISTSPATNTATSNHNYALPANLANKVVFPPSTSAPTSLKTSTAGGIRMVQIVPRTVQSTNVSTLQGNTVKGSTSNTNVPSGLKTVTHAQLKLVSQAGLNTLVQARQNKVVTSSAVATVVPTGQSTLPTNPPTTSQAIKNIVPKTSTTLRVKPQGNQPVTSQTKIIFIPAASVDAKSPLANFKPQTLTTTSGQSIYGYAVVVPPGSSEEVNAVINSSLKKSSQTTTVTPKQGLSSTQGKLTVLQGKPTSTGVQGKPIAVSTQAKSTVVLPKSTSTINLQGKPHITVLQGKPNTSMQGNSTITALHGKPAVASLQGNSVASLLQQKPSTVLQGKSKVDLQGNPTLLGQPITTKSTNTSSKILISNTIASQIPGNISFTKGIAAISTPANKLPGNTVVTSVIGSSQLHKALTSIKTSTSNTSLQLPLATSVKATIQNSSISVSSTASGITSTLQSYPAAATTNTTLVLTDPITSTTSSITDFVQQHHVAANLTKKTPSCPTSISTSPIVTGTIQRQPITTTIATTVTSLPTPSSTITSLPSSIKPGAVPVGRIPVQLHSGKLTLLELARSNIQAATIASANQSSSLVPPTNPSIITSQTKALPATIKVTTPTQHPSTSNHQSSVTDVPTSNISGTSRPHIGVPSSTASTSAVVTQSQSNVIPALISSKAAAKDITLPQQVVMTTISNNSAYDKQLQPATLVTATAKPDSDIVATVTVIPSQPECDAAIETNLTKTDSITSSKTSDNSSTSSTIQPQTDGSFDNVILLNPINQQRNNDLVSSSTENNTSSSSKDEVNTLSIKDSDIKSPLCITVFPSASSKDKLPSPAKVLALSDNQKLAFCNGMSVHPPLDNSSSTNSIKTCTVSEGACEAPSTDAVRTKNLTDVLSTKTGVISKDLSEVLTTSNGVHSAQESQETQLEVTDT